jgi:hypothetical protein
LIEVEARPERNGQRIDSSYGAGLAYGLRPQQLA